jgi:hypothetical protein
VGRRWGVGRHDRGDREQQGCVCFVQRHNGAPGNVSRHVKAMKVGLAGVVCCHKGTMNRWGVRVLNLIGAIVGTTEAECCHKGKA